MNVIENGSVFSCMVCVEDIDLGRCSKNTTTLMSNYFWQSVALYKIDNWIALITFYFYFPLQFANFMRPWPRGNKDKGYWNFPRNQRKVDKWVEHLISKFISPHIRSYQYNINNNEVKRKTLWTWYKYEKI